MSAVAARLLSDANVAAVNGAIVTAVGREYGLKIRRQAPEAVRAALVRELRDWNDERSAIPADDEPTTVAGVVAELGERATRRAARTCAENYHARVRFIEDQSTLPVPLEHATNESIRGTQLGDMGGSLEV